MENANQIESLPGHFESVVFGDEIMVANDPLDSRFSVMSLAVAADSGWYDVNFETGDQYSWGYNKGCAILKSKCQRNALNEFCQLTRTTGCSDNFKYITICRKNRFTEKCILNVNHQNCKVFRKFNHKSFKYGRSSICQNYQVSVVFQIIG